jgi:hypothetical protein
MQFRESGPQEPVINAAVEQGGLEARVSEAVALGFGDALNEAMQAEAAQILAPAPGGDF